MDIAFSIISGLFLRAFTHRFDVEPLSKLSSAFVGAWEGVVVHQMSSRSPSELDHYLAYGLRVLVDYMISRDQSKTVMILVWTVLGAVASEFVTPRTTLRAPSPKRRSRSSRARTSRLRHHLNSNQLPALPVTSTTAKLPILPPNLQIGTPVTITKPPSPPSCFLGADSDILDPLSPIPAPVHPLDLSPTRPPTGLASHLEKGEDNDSPARKPVLPTPPQSAPSDGLGNSRPATSPHRLSTIQEMSSAAERTPPPPPLPQPPQPAPPPPAVTEKAAPQPTTSTNPSGANSPLPIPNSTMQGFSISNPFNDEDDDGGIQHSTPFAKNAPAPVPVPNMSTTNWRPHIPDPLSVDPFESPPWKPEDDLDELSTPPHNGAGSSIANPGEVDGDPLRTPNTMDPNILSPLVLEEELGNGGVPLVSVIPTPMPSISQVQALIDSTTTTPVPASTKTKKGKAAAAGANAAAGPSTSTVPTVNGGTLLSAEAPATPASPPKPHQDVDPDSHSDGATSVLSTPEPNLMNIKAEKLRQAARDADKEVSELRSKHVKAINEGRTGEAFLLKRKMIDAEEKAKELHKKAARRYYASLNELNPKKKEDTIDVHGLRPTEAVDKTERALSQAIDNGHTTLRVIVGKGIHSVGGQPVLKKVITETMERQKIAVQVDSKNAGVLIVTVPAV